MHFLDINDAVGNLAVITTILQFLSGILVCKQYVINKTTAETSPLPFLCGVLSASLWLLYGLTKHDDKIVLVNMIGALLMSSYTIVFYIYTLKKSSLLKHIMITVSLVLFVIGYVSVEPDKGILLRRLGILACSLTLLTIAAPMSKLLYVLKMRSTECLPFPMILMSFFVSALWFLYGLLQHDAYLLLPNGMGAVLSLAQLLLFVIYPSKSPTPLKTMLA